MKGILNSTNILMDSSLEIAELERRLEMLAISMISEGQGACDDGGCGGECDTVFPPGCDSFCPNDDGCGSDCDKSPCDDFSN